MCFLPFSIEWKIVRLYVSWSSGFSTDKRFPYEIVTEPLSQSAPAAPLPPTPYLGNDVAGTFKRFPIYT